MSDGEQVAWAKPTNTLGQAGPASELSHEQPSQAAGHATQLVHLGEHRTPGHSQAQLPALPDQPSLPRPTLELLLTRNFVGVVAAAAAWGGPGRPTASGIRLRNSCSNGEIGSGTLSISSCWHAPHWDGLIP